MCVYDPERDELVCTGCGTTLKDMFSHGEPLTSKQAIEISRGRKGTSEREGTKKHKKLMQLFSDEEQEILQASREAHPELRTREGMKPLPQEERRLLKKTGFEPIAIAMAEQGFRLYNEKPPRKKRGYEELLERYYTEKR